MSNAVDVVCPCGETFRTTQRLLDQGRGKYCSKACMYQYRTRPSGLTYEIKVENKAWFKPGHAPTASAFKPGERNSPATEFKPGQRASPETEFKAGHEPWNLGTSGVMPSGPEHPGWTGDSAGYDALHDWVRKRLVKPESCPACGKRKPLDLSNISGEYHRKISDWQYLCRSCHFKYDRENIPGAMTARFPERRK